MNNYLIGGVAALALAGGAFMLFGGSGNGDGSNTATQNSAVATSGVGADIDNDSNIQAVAATSSSNGTTGNSSSSSNGTPRLHPVEAACVEYEMVGQLMNGTTIRCHRNYAYEQYEIQNTTIGIAGMTQTQNQHTITIGDTIYAIDVAAGTGTKTKNPMYEGLVNALKNASPEEMSARFIAGMGFSPNGESKTIAGENCDMYSAAQLGVVCLTEGGLMLEQSFMGNTQTAVDVSIGDGGAEENYALYQTVQITDGPDLSNGLQGLIDQMGNQ